VVKIIELSVVKMAIKTFWLTISKKTEC